MTPTADVAIAGGGIVGAACADALACEGLRVTVIESDFAGAGATAAGMGHILVMDDSEAEFALTRYSRDLWLAAAGSLPPEAEVDFCGTLWVAADEEEMAEVHRKAQFASARGVRAEALDADSLAKAEPNLRRPLSGALYVPDDIVIYAPCAAQWLIGQACRRGAALESGHVVGMDGGGVRLADGRRISAGATVCAAGVQSAALFPELALEPRKGHLAITDRYPGFVRHQLVELGYLKSAHGEASESVAFNVQPRKTGQLLIGSSRQYSVTRPGVDPGVFRRMIERALWYMPDLARLSVIRSWTGFRPSTPDKLPAIGPCPEHDNVWLATGHEGVGIASSLGTARILADLIMGRTPAIDPSPYSPARLWKAAAHG